MARRLRCPVACELPIIAPGARAVSRRGRQCPYSALYVTDMFDIVRQDLRRCVRVNQMGTSYTLADYLRELFNPGTQAIIIHRFGVWSDRIRFMPLRYFLRTVHFLMQALLPWRAGIYIPIRADIGPGIAIHTWGGGVCLPACKIGRNLTIIGGGVLFDYATLEIGDDVTIGAGTKGTGRRRIGNRVTTGPNSVVIEDVPDDSLVFGNPGRVIPKPRPRRTPARPAGSDSSQPVQAPSDPGSTGAPEPTPAATAASVSAPRLAAL